MARFKLSSGDSLQALGKAIRIMGARFAAYGLGSQQLNGQQAEAESVFASHTADDIVFEDSLAIVERQRERAASALSGKKDAVFVQFHFDQTVEDMGDAPFRIVNVVVNDFANKLVRDGEGNVVTDDDDEPMCDLNGIAEEALGYIVFARCG